MIRPWLRMAVLIALGSVALAADRAPAVSAPPAKAAKTRPRSDPNGNPIRYAATGHVSNYDEAKVRPYTLPDPLVLQNGQPVRDAGTWFSQRRPEILKAYATEIFGGVPATAPTVTWHLVETEPAALGGTAIRQRITGRIGDGADAPTVNLTVYLPANASAPVPLLLHTQFFNPLRPPPAPAPATTTAAPVATVTVPGIAPAATAAARPRLSEDGPIADFLAHGYGYATYCYTDFEGDSAATSLTRARKLALAPGQEKPAADEWGTITTWSWAASRVLDYLETEPAVDAKRVAFIGHSRLGKTALYAGATDPRFALIFASCSGEMGAALSRRDWGESVDDMAASFPWWFAGNFQKYVGHWDDMPVDAHLLIALNAPRPVFITGGTQDQWADPKGEFLAEVAAGPVYRLLGKADLGARELPPFDTPLITGSLGFHYHTGGHMITAADWKAFLAFADRHLQPGAAGN